MFKIDTILSNIGLFVNEVQCASPLEVKHLERETVKFRYHQVSKLRMCGIFILLYVCTPSIGTGATSHYLFLPKMYL
jgi:hypothetical protein